MSEKNAFPEPPGFSRRELARRAGVVALGAVVPGSVSAADLLSPAVLSSPDASANLYEALGVRPVINARGTITVIGGSIELPEVRAAKTLANQQFVQLDELMEGVGRRLAELTGADWGMVSAGCAAAMSHATAACVAGGNPDLHVRIPNLAGFPKDEVIMPTHSYNSYVAAVRAVGVRMIDVETPEQLRLAIGPRTAMIYFEAKDSNETGPLSLEAIAAIAKPHDIPILVDAAPEILTVPNIHLQRGATLVAYSGGKCIRGPQSAGLLLGRKDLVKAAWVHSAPHHGYARSMKVGREEMIGMLVAVESWVKRDHEREWQEWISRCEHIAQRVSRVPGVTATVRNEKGGRGNRTPGVTIRWDPNAMGITGAEVTRILDTTEPRIALGGGGRPGQDQSATTGISMSVYMMAPGEEKIVAERVAQVLSAKRTAAPVAPPKAPAANLSGHWKVDIAFAASRSTHTVDLVQDGNRLQGTHQGDFRARELTGSIDGDQVTFATRPAIGHGENLSFRFTGTLNGESMGGTLDMGEYLTANWQATRHVPNRPRS
jgi:L-seryl-tRNA(Ser) seleniumtransferase